MGKVIVERFLGSRKNPEFTGVLLRETVKQDNLTTVLLGGDQFEKSRVTAQTMSKAVIAKFGIKEGSDLGASIGKSLRLRVIESTEEAPGFQAKMNPATKEYLKSNGKQIYRKTVLAAANEQDELIKHDTVAIPAKKNLV